MLVKVGVNAGVLVLVGVDVGVEVRVGGTVRVRKGGGVCLPGGVGFIGGHQGGLPLWPKTA